MSTDSCVICGSPDQLHNCIKPDESAPLDNVIETRHSTTVSLLTQLDAELERATQHFNDEGFHYLEVCMAHTDGAALGWGPINDEHGIWRGFFWMDKEGVEWKRRRLTLKGEFFSQTMTPISMKIAVVSLISDMRKALYRYLVEAMAARLELKAFNDNYDAALAATGEPPTLPEE